MVINIAMKDPGVGMSEREPLLAGVCETPNRAINVIPHSNVYDWH
jgi:hypothetical protein